MEGMSSSGGLEIGISCITVPHFITGGQKHTHIGTMKTLLCIEDQNGNHVVYHCRTHVPFGPLFSKYMSNKGIPPIGGLFLSNGRKIRHSETPKGMGFDTSFHVIIFVNLLKFINQDKLEYQDNYPLTEGNEREGVLDEHTMKDAIDASIKRGHVVKIVPEGDEVLPPPHERYCVQEGQECRFYWWSLYMAHHHTDIVFGDHSKTEVLFEVKTIRQSSKAAKNWLIKNRKWGGQLLFTHWLNCGLIHVIEISSSNPLVNRHGSEFSPFVGARIVVGIMQFIANGMMIRPNAPGNIIGRGRIAALNEVSHVNLPKAV
jgi:hypothetical protein